MTSIIVNEPSNVRNILSQLSEAAKVTIRISKGNSDDERIINVDDAFEAEITAADPDVFAPSQDDVRAEAARRLIALMGARDRDHLERIIQDGTREAVKLLRVGSANWTAEQTARVAALEAAEGLVDAMDAASKALRTQVPIPLDYADDKYWPAVS